MKLGRVERRAKVRDGTAGRLSATSSSRERRSRSAASRRLDRHLNRYDGSRSARSRRGVVMRMFGEVSSCDAGTRTLHKIDSRIDPIVQAAERRSGSFRDRRADGHTRDRSTLALAIQGCAFGDCVLSRRMRTFTASSFWRFRGLHRPNVAAGETLKRVDAVGRARKFQPTCMGLAALLAGHIGSRLHRLASVGRRRASFNTAS